MNLIDANALCNRALARLNDFESLRTSLVEDAEIARREILSADIGQYSGGEPSMGLATMDYATMELAEYRRTAEDALYAIKATLPST